MNVRQELFFKHYISNKLNATQAALSAGYSKKTAYSQGQRLLKNVEVKKEISKYIAELLSDTEMATLKIINALDDIIDSDIGTFANIKTITIKNSDDTKTKYKKVVFKNTQKLNTNVLSEISENKDGGIKIKMHDKLKAIELKGKFLSLWQDGVLLIKKEQTEEEKLSDKEVKERILSLSKKLGYL